MKVQLKSTDGTENLYPVTAANSVIFPDGNNLEAKFPELVGKSAYQSWLDAGHTGTEAEFVESLQGKDGKDGKDGAQGNSGYTGAAGELEVVNNLTDGGATAALSAEQGKILKKTIESIAFENIVDVAEDGFYLIDSEGYVCAKYTSAGWSVVAIDNAYISLLKRYISVELGDVTGTAFDGGEGSELKRRVTSLESQVSGGAFLQHYYLPYEVARLTNRPNHDCTWVGSELWSFDKPSDGGNLKIYDSSLALVSSKKTSFYETRKDSSSKELEMKSVDWNAEKQALLISNGAASYSSSDSYSYIFYEAQSWKNSSATITFENCGEYKQIDFTELGGKCYAFWGPSPELVFVSINLFANVFLVRLGMGTTQLSKGVFVSADSGKYNGSWEILGTWTQIPIATGSYAAHGGQYYNGSLYLATNDSSVCQIYKCDLKNSGNLQFKVIHLERYNEDGSIVYRYIDGLCIKDGKFYAQALNTTGGYSNAMLIANVI